MSKEHTQVLIVGGGIVGLSASLFLSYHGIASLLVERHSSTSIHPRSRSVNARTMELYRSLGIDEAVRLAGASLSQAQGVYQGPSLAEVIGSHKRKEENGGKPEMMPGAQLFEWMGPVARAWGTQDVTEPVLRRAAKERGGDLRFGVEFVSCVQDGGGVEAMLRDRSDGREWSVHAEYLLACDGAGSRIRRNLGVSTTGAGTLGYLLNILFEADLGGFVRGREFSMCLIDRPGIRGNMTAINNSNIWVFHLVYDPRKGQGVDDFPPERCEQIVKSAIGLPDVEVNIKSILPWEPSVRVAERFQHGRIFLAGDAAHQMPPYGGQGANSGIADVHNLAWKLAAVLNQQAPTALLETYDEERVPITRLVSEESGAATDDDGLFLAKKSVAIPRLVLRMPRIAGYGYRYSSRAINTADTTPFFWKQRWLLQTLPRVLSLDATAGTRAPHLWVHRESKRISTLDLCGKNFVLLAGEDGEEWRAAAPKVSSSVGVNLAVYTAGPAEDLVCCKGAWESAAWISPKGALLIRPDGFVAWRSWSQPPDLRHKLTEVLKQALCQCE